MSSAQPAVIVAKALTKRFRSWNNRSGSVKTLLVRLLSFKENSSTAKSTDTVLENLSFSIQAGDFVGIMGRNGAGKSTLLKLISGIYSPTSGSISVTRPIAPLIELGAGFHPDLTGYENIFLNAAVLGVGRDAITNTLPEILAFADLGDHIQMPIKHYSSGMMVRLGFAIASHLNAPILLLDEVLAVGDLDFQRKCLERIHHLHRAGHTIVLITHDPSAVETHCSRCIVMNRNHIVYDGAAPAGAEVYRSLMSPRS